MADNFTANAGSGGSTFASDDIGGIQFPRVKLTIGADGSNDGDVSSSLPMPSRLVPVASGGCDVFRTTSLVATSQTVKGAAGTVYGLIFSNLATATRYIKFYNSASPTIGTTAPLLTLPVPGNASDATSGVISFPQGIAFSTAITVACTTGLADSDTTAPTASTVILNVLYK